MITTRHLRRVNGMSEIVSKRFWSDTPIKLRIGHQIRFKGHPRAKFRVSMRRSNHLIDEILVN